MTDKPNALQVHRQALLKVSDHFRDALPTTAKKYLTPERITQVVCTALSTSPQLLQCSPRSILKATMDCVQVGLEPGGPLGHSYLVPFKNKGVLEATPIIGYKGYITLAMRSGFLSAPPHVHLVRESDKFDWDLGSGQPPTHKIDFKLDPKDRGEIIGGYAVAQFAAGGCHVEWMTIREIETVKSRSRGSNSGYSPWNTDFEQMARKTILRRAKNYWPISGESLVDMSRATMVDDSAETGVRPPDHVVYSADFLDDVMSTPETLDQAGMQQSKVDKASERLERNSKWDHVGPPPMETDNE